MSEFDEFKRNLKRFLEKEGVHSYLIALHYKGQDEVLGEGEEKTLVHFLWKLTETLRIKFRLL